MATTKSRTKRKAPVLVTLAKFDTREPIYRAIREGVSIGAFPAVTEQDYLPSGGTPLRDATARFIGHLDELRGPEHVTIGLLLDESGSMSPNRGAVLQGVNHFVDGMSDVKAIDPKAAGTVLAVIVTDGYENASHEVDLESLQAMVRDREGDGFSFIFLGAAIDAWSQGASLGLSGGVSGQMVSYVNTPKGTSNVMAAATADSMSYLSDVGSYKQARVGSTTRSVTEDGQETTANINAPTSVASGTPNITVQNFGFGAGTPYADVKEAIERAKKVTS